MESRTFYSPATSPGEGGIHVVQLAGPAAGAIVERAFRTARKGPPSGGPSLAYGHVVDDTGPLDEVLLVRIRADNPWDTLYEIHLHGGPATLRAVTRRLEELGAAPLSSGRFFRRGSRPGEPPATRRARILLAGARTPFAADLLASQTGGILARALRESAGALASAARGGPLEEARRRLGPLLDANCLGAALVDPPRIQILGPPNGGKSTLFNALLGRERALVDASPGTTRDRVGEEADFLGVPVRLSDSAGLTERPADPVDAAGVEEARRGAREASLRMFLFDGGRPPAAADIREWEGIGEPRLALVGKADLPGGEDVRACLERSLERRILPVSGLGGLGLDELAAAALASLGIRLPGREAAPAAVPLGGRMSRLLAEAGAALDRGESGTLRRVAAALEWWGRGR